MSARRTRSGLARVAVVTAALAIAAYALPRAASAQGRWLPREVRPNSSLTPAQLAEAKAFFDRVERVLKQVPEIAHPDGYEILPIVGGGMRQDAPGFEGESLPNSILEYELHLGFYLPSRERGGERTTCIMVTVNDPQQARLQDAQGRWIYIEPDRFRPGTNPDISDSRVPRKALQVYGELWNIPKERSGVDVIFVTAGELPWKPVSREEYYGALRFDHEGANGEKLADYRETLEKTPYQVWMEGAVQRKADREAALAQLRGILPDSALERTRREQEAIEREVTETMKRSEATDRERQSEAHTLSFAWGDSLNAELARMSPEERRMPAVISRTTDQGPRASGAVLTTDTTPPNNRVLTPNDAFYRMRRSPLEVRSITVRLAVGGNCLAPRIQHMIWTLYHTLDWAAFNNLLETPR